MEIINEDEIHDFKEIYDHRVSAKERTASQILDLTNMKYLNDSSFLSTEMQNGGKSQLLFNRSSE